MALSQRTAEKAEAAVPQPLLSNVWTEEAQAITYENMQKLSRQDSFQIGEKTYQRKILKPKDIVAINRLQKKSDEATSRDDDEAGMNILKEQAKIVLKDFTDAEFEEIDVVMLQSVVGACLLISKGFRRIQ